MFAHGYRKQVNVDNCEVVVAQQRERYPMLTWKVLQTADVSDQVYRYMYCQVSNIIKGPSVKCQKIKCQGPQGQVRIRRASDPVPEISCMAHHVIAHQASRHAHHHHRRSASPANSAVQVMDVRSMGEFADGAFDIVLDKGLLDNLYCYREVGS